VSLRGDQHRGAIRVVLDTFGEDALHFVFVGGCVLGLYARPHAGGSLRTTKDVDCISTRVPWVLQEKLLSDLCTRGVQSPVQDLACRLRILGTDVLVDVLSPEGRNVGGVNPFFQRASVRARAYDVGYGRLVNAVTPAYFLENMIDPEPWVTRAHRGPRATPLPLSQEYREAVEAAPNWCLRPSAKVSSR
jgi:hypothetical protein